MFTGSIVLLKDELCGKRQNPLKRMSCAYSRHILQDKNNPKCTNQLFHQIFTDSSPTKKCGVLISISQAMTFQLHNVTRDKTGRYSIHVYKLNNVTHTLVNLYAPNSGQLSLKRWTDLKRATSYTAGTLIVW